MLDKIGHIKNPLTVIAMFAAIAEVSGALVLPFIAPENQLTYIWFLMVFPVLLVLVFFLTLNFNHKSLYAPSDWKDESNFFRKFSPATPQERQKKLKDEVADAEAEARVIQPLAKLPAKNQEVPPVQTDQQKSIDLTHLGRDRINRYRTAERSAISKLSSDLQMLFRPGIAFHSSKTRRVLFDAVAIDQDRVNAIEVKLIFGNSVSRPQSDRILLETENVAKTMKENGKDFVLHYVAVLDNAEIDRSLVESRLRNFLNDYDYNIKLHIFSFEELNEYTLLEGQPADP